MASEVKQTILIPELDKYTPEDKSRETRAQLTLTTYKATSGGVISSARVEYAGNGFVSMALGRDYSKTVTPDKTARATQKAIDSQHIRAFTAEAIEAIKVEAAAHYANKTLY